MSQSPTSDTSDAGARQPSARQMLLLDVPHSVRISPGGHQVAFLVRSTNWRDNRYEMICYVHDQRSGATHQMNRTGTVHQIEWLDDQTLALLKQEHGDEAKAQIQIHTGLVGEGWRVTDHKSGVETFKPFAGGILFVAKDPDRQEQKPRRERFGTFVHFEQEESASALYYVGMAEWRRHEAVVRAGTEQEAKALVAPVVEISRLLPEPLAIKSVVPAPTGDAIYLTCWDRDDLVYRRNTHVFRIELDAAASLAAYCERETERKADQRGQEVSTRAEEREQSEDWSYLGTITRLPLPQGAGVEAVSPDGQTLLIAHKGRDDKIYTQEELWLLDVQTVLAAADVDACRKQMRSITRELDRDVLDVYWTDHGIYASYVDGTRVRVARLHANGQATPLDLGAIFPQYSFHISAAGPMGLVGASAESFPEVYTAAPGDEGAPWLVARLTDFGAPVEDWDLGTVEVIRWTSKDGTQIEGVLRKPSHFDPSRSYPLVFVVHGGPRWFSSSALVSGEDLAYYPTVQFVNQDVLVLKPNYRGSMGYGQGFTELNVDNLGVGDLWDLESAVDHLVARGWVDESRVGCMGWSQGGYISAFAGLHSTICKAVSVGAGISDWYTYHISNDIPDFTVDYLSGSPFHDRELYAKTAPIANLANARTPMLIQHGEDDRRVPLANAMELYRGLKEMDVPVELFVFPGMGHPITKPRENHAILHQNLAWFRHYLLGEPLALV